ncbi:hypothetical protein A6E15_19395 [Natrinema saccharevitans]|uniref:Uncharacterized protein n=1 Tax=Natrinema saccharevitans TaxID=301967 RepID=A0A1S8AR40_9EURY|nr:hypothetical protein [Natrinema saccharevitans]OLZ39130.1 hypothetical protein A6E15_19395 [Natrinema saccharevitans]
MAVRERDPDTTDERLEITNTVHLKPLGIDVPSGATCELTFRGTRGNFIVSIERNGNRWTLEGSEAQAELTGAFTEDGIADKPTRVPDWIARVMDAKIDVSEVSVQR